MDQSLNSAQNSNQGDYRDLFDRRAFVSDEVWRLELKRVFTRTWQLVGFDPELPDPGDYVVRRMGNDNIILARDERGSVHVLLNSCNHRGTQLCRATFGNAAHFRCSYHGWTYANDGRLIGVPSIRSNYPDGFQKGSYELAAARTTSYRGFIFATWDHEGPSLEDYLGDFRWYLDAMLDLAGGEWEVYGPPQRSIMRGNWKIPTDNFAGDGYHMQTAHQSAFEMGIYGDSLANGTQGKRDLELIAINVATEQGHALRAGYVVEKGEREIGRGLSHPVYMGYPEEMWPIFSSHQTAEEIRFNSHCEVLHGTVFPNASFLSVSHDRAIGRASDPLTRYTVWRVHLPVGARQTECMYWVLVPKMMSAEWKRRSYAYQARSQSAGGMLFEMDDFDNFARIDTAIGGPAADGAPLDLSLGLDRGEAVPGFPGPGHAEYITLSEHNQRAFYCRWASLMRDAA